MGYHCTTANHSFKINIVKRMMRFIDVPYLTQSKYLNLRKPHLLLMQIFLHVDFAGTLEIRLS